jgi:hypothetical protein
MEYPKLILSSIGVTWLGKGCPINLGILYQARASLFACLSQNLSV